MKTAINSILIVLLTSPAFITNGGVPSTLSYQGRVQVAGTNFTGTGYFKFALVSRGSNTVRQAAAVATVNSGFLTAISVTDGGTGYSAAPAVVITDSTGSGASATANVSGGAVSSITVNNAGNAYSASPGVTVAPPPPQFAFETYWSNDGTSAGGSEPLAAVQVGVQAGLFTVYLGNTNLPNMASIPIDTFQNPDVHVRIWFSDGVQSFAQLSPDQPLSSVGYAMIAAQYNGPIADTQLPANIARLDGTNQTFTGAVNFNSQSSAFVGSFTGDGSGISNVNLATINSGGAITLLSNLTFTANSLAVGMTPRSVAAADLNGDGHNDLVSANLTASTLSVLLNNGRGDFALGSSPGVGSGPQCVAAADVNGDGHIDLISANSTANTLSVLTNNGSGVFPISSSPTVGLNPYFVVAADVNGDGRTDLVSANFGTNTLSVLTNNGAGVFTLSSSPTVNYSPHSLAAADLNGDGYIDLVSPSLFPYSLSVLTNNGSGFFASATNLALDTSAYPLWVTATDVNEDGRNDLISANWGMGTVSVLTNNGLGGFPLASMPNAGSNPHSIAASDVSGDGRVDLIVANQGSTLSFLTNNGGGRFMLATAVNVGFGASSVTAADLNGDGRNEFISANQSDNTVSVVSQFGFQFTGRFLGDFNGDFSGSFTGNFSGNGAGLTGLNASNITSGTLSDARLSTGIARRAGGNAFTGAQTISSSGVALTVSGTAQVVALVDSTQTTGTWLGIENSSTGGQRWSIISTGSGNGEGAGRLLFFTSQSSDTKMRLEPTGNLAIDGTLSQGSDRNVKENLRDIDPQEVLERVTKLPITRWSYRDDPSADHIGPMAQDFYSAFSLGSDNKSITTVDADGVALAAIQGLNEKVETENRSLRGELKAKDAQLQTLKQRLNDLELFVRKVTASRD